MRGFSKEKESFNIVGVDGHLNVTVKGTKRCASRMV